MIGKILNKRLLFPALSVVAVSAFPAAFLYFQNADEVGFSEVARFLLGSVAAGLLIFAALAALTRQPAKTAIMAVLCMTVLLNFAYIEKAIKLVLPDLKYWHMVPIVVAVLLHVLYLIGRLMKEDTARDVSMVLGLVFGGLLLLNLATAMPDIAGRMQTQRMIKAEQDGASIRVAPADADLPNVYLLIFDEYANFTEMQKCYNYDNAPLKDFLLEHDFNISYTSHNESIFSHTVQTNMVSLDYVVDDETELEKSTLLRHNGLLFQVMREHGYDVRILENGDFYGGSMPGGSRSDSTAAKTINGETMEKLLLLNTLPYPLFQKSDIRRIQDYQIIVDYMRETVGEIQDTFTLAYFCLPHQPLVVDANGNELGQDALIGETLWSNKEYYLGQFQFTTKLMLPILDEIVEKDPNSIVLLMSDHGVRGTPDATYEMKTNSLNTLYYQGKEFDIEGLSNVNTLRAVLNALFDMGYEMLEVPDKGGID